MANPWFKFYGSEYLSDPKIDQLTPSERSCWITLLSLACAVGKGGRIDNLKISTLLTKAGIFPLDSAGEQMGMEDVYTDNLGVLEHFESLDMIQRVDVSSYQITHWEERQETALTEAERQAKHREKKKSHVRHDSVVTESHGARDESNARIEENRIDKNIVTADAEETVERVDDNGDPITPRGFTKKPKDDNARVVLEEIEGKMGRKFVQPIKEMAVIRQMLDKGYTRAEIVEEWGYQSKHHWKVKKGQGITLSDVAALIHIEHD